MPITEYDEDFQKFSGRRTFGRIKVPLDPDDSDVPCLHAHNVLGAVVEMEGGVRRGIMAMSRRGEEPGLYSAFDVEECRAQARAFKDMADYLEREEAMPKPVRSFEEMIRNAGGQFIDLSASIPPDPNVHNQVVWTLSRWAHKMGVSYDALGHIPQFLHTDDERSAKEQIDDNYQHGGGWREANGDGHWKLLDNGSRLQGDPADEPYNLIASCRVGADEVLLFDSAWCAIVHPDGTMNVARLD